MKILTVAMIAALALPVCGARAQDQLSSPEAIALRNQILQLQAQVNALEPNPGSAVAAPAPVAGSAPQTGTGAGLMADLVTRIANLEDQVRTLTGQVDELGNQVKQQNIDLGKRIDDITFQLQGGTTRSAPDAASSDAATPAPASDGSGSKATPPTSLAPQGASATPNLPTGSLGTLPVDQTAPPDAAQPTPTTTLQAGLTALQRKDYATAAKDARAVLATHRATPSGYDAQFLLARALAGQHAWENAAVAFDDTYKRSLYGSHSQEAQLGEARALLALGDGGAACGALDRLGRQYPTPRAELAPEIASVRAQACRR